MDNYYRNGKTFTLKDLTGIDKTYKYTSSTNGEYKMKLDKIKFARLIAFCISNGMDAGEPEINFIDDIIDIEPGAVPIDNINLEDLMLHMANGTNKIYAIKSHRALTGMSIKDSKDVIEKYWRVEATPKKSAKELQEQMIRVLNDDRCMIKSKEMKVLVRDFIYSFSVD